MAPWRDRQRVLGEEGLDRARDHFDPYHRMALSAQPQHVLALAAQRHEHGIIRRNIHARPIAPQIRVDVVLMETDAPFVPARLPEFTIHNHLVSYPG